MLKHKKIFKIFYSNYNSITDRKKKTSNLEK